MIFKQKRSKSITKCTWRFNLHISIDSMLLFNVPKHWSFYRELSAIYSVQMSELKPCAGIYTDAIEENDRYLHLWVTNLLRCRSVSTSAVSFSTPPKPSRRATGFCKLCLQCAKSWFQRELILPQLSYQFLPWYGLFTP